MITHYKLIGRIPVPCNSIEEWQSWFLHTDRAVGRDNVGPLFVSTVFLGVDHNHSGRGDPMLFETMIFDGNEDSYQVRCSTWGQAEIEHHTAVEVAKKFAREARYTVAAVLNINPEEEPE
jgi:hypothetical protein